ncbi:RIP metalloprotease RseP [Moraxella oblonga]|uniref:RIP metalloprotease RseP n=1 Tax=Moraxella oblonga TaxID=200413 RepID=UPI00082AA3E3|nr:RIP metalloprotease RseP [Moraxella oblonga]
MNGLLMFLAAVCVLTPLVALHEWGHYIVARLCGVKVLTYSIGMGPRLFGWTSKKTGIDYRISALPLGGYVKMLDEREGEVAESEKHLAFNNAHPLKKIAIVIAGPVMNFLIAIGLFFVIFLNPSEQLNTRIGRIIADTPVAKSTLTVGEKIIAIDDKPINTWENVNFALADRMGENGVVNISTDKGKYSIEVVDFMQGADKGKDPLTAIGVLPYRPIVPPVIDKLTKGGAGELMGLKVGDKITHIDGRVIDDWLSMTQIVQNNPEKMLVFGVVRNGENVEVKVMPRAVKANGRTIGQIGVGPRSVNFDVPDDYKMTVHHTPKEAFTKAFVKTYDLSVMTLNAMGKMLSGLIGIDNLSGPITIAEVSKDSIQMGWLQALSTAGLISLSLAVLNLLPIPVLDGGHLVFYTYEWLVGKPINKQWQIKAMQVGMLLLLGFMVLATGNDILRILG